MVFGPTLTFNENIYYHEGYIQVEWNLIQCLHVHNGIEYRYVYFNLF